MDFDYKVLMHDSEAQVYDGVINYFTEQKQTYHNNIKSKRSSDDDSNIEYIKKDIREKMRQTGFDDIEIADILVKYSYSIANDKYKKLLWIVYGDVILENIKFNLKDSDPYCLRCGKRFKKRSNHHKFCDDCANLKIYKVRKVICQDCGKEFEVPLNVRRKKRCDECQAEKNREREREKKRRQRMPVPSFNEF